MNTTKILGEAVGVQTQRLKDYSESYITSRLISALVIGRFKRGEVGRPMIITLGNIRGQLGYDPKNPDYIAVQACLDAGVSSVQVLRVSDITSLPPKTQITLEFSDQLSINASLQDSTISQLKYVVSGLYPIEAIDELTVSASIQDGNLRQSYVLTANDDMTVSAAMADGDIRQILRSTTIDIDSMTVAASLSDGEIRQILRGTTIDSDELAVSASMQDGSIKQILIATAIDTDNITVTASLQDGELKNG